MTSQPVVVPQNVIVALYSHTYFENLAAKGGVAGMLKDYGVMPVPDQEGMYQMNEMKVEDCSPVPVKGSSQMELIVSIAGPKRQVDGLVSKMTAGHWMLKTSD